MSSTHAVLGRNCFGVKFPEINESSRSLPFSILMRLIWHRHPSQIRKPAILSHQVQLDGISGTVSIFDDDDFSSTFRRSTSCHFFTDPMIGGTVNECDNIGILFNRTIFM